MLSKMMILLVCLVSLNSCDFVPPDSWTIDDKGMVKRELSDSDCDALNKPHGCKEELTIKDWCVKYMPNAITCKGIIITQDGAENITKEILNCHSELASCKQGN